MSSVNPNIRGQKTFEMEASNAFNDLVQYDAIRLQKLLGIFQSVVVYIIICLVIGRLMHKMFPNDTRESLKLKSSSELVGVVVAQTVVFTISVYYIHKMALVVPVLFNLTPNFVPRDYSETLLAGGVVISILLMRFTPSLDMHLSELVRRYYAYMDSFNSMFM